MCTPPIGMSTMLLSVLSHMLTIQLSTSNNSLVRVLLKRASFYTSCEVKCGFGACCVCVCVVEFMLRALCVHVHPLI